MLWYQFEPFVAYNAMGRYQDVVALADQTLATTTSVEEIWYWKGQALSALGDATGARAAFAQAVALNPEYTVAVDALASIDG
jgi:tetratricopeptide (TPR) repeat protein